MCQREIIRLCLGSVSFGVPAVYRSCLESQPPGPRNLEVYDIAQLSVLEINIVLGLASPTDRRGEVGLSKLSV